MAAEPIRILAFGDSLTAGWGLPQSDGFTVQLEHALVAKGYNAIVANGGQSGDTTADGRARLDWALGDAYDYAIVELGANDALRGLDTEEAYRNLDAIITGMESKHIKILLAGMYAPRNFGPTYTKAFDDIYPRLIAAHPGVALYPFFLDGAIQHAELLQADGIHPNAKGVATIVEKIIPSVEKLIGPRAGKS